MWDFIITVVLLGALMNKTKVISADLLDFDFEFEEIFMFGNISILLTFPYKWHFSFDKILVLVTIHFWWNFSFGDISVLVTFQF